MTESDVPYKDEAPRLPVATKTCPDCWAVAGATHELSCPEVTPELAMAYSNTIHGKEQT